MIVYNLSCDNGHRFEGWFGSSEAFANQSERSLLSCPQCGSLDIVKAPMAPAISLKSAVKHGDGKKSEQDTKNGELPLAVLKAVAALERAQERALKDSTWVGEKFADESRAMHYGEQDEKPIHGKASLTEAKALVEEGIKVARLPLPVTPPEKLN